MNPTAYLASIAALGLSLLAGCGGNVVLDHSGATGGGSGIGGGGAGGGTTGTTSTVTTTPTDTGSYCKGVCSTALQYGCFTDGDLAGCIQACEEGFAQAPNCTAEFTALYDCAVASLPNYGCDGLNQACPKQLDDYSTCVNGSTTTCGTDGCTGDGYSCSCTGQCNGYKVEVDCKGQPGSTVECQCLVGGGYVGSCQDESLSCDLLGCCSQYFPL